ncbi:hypothetical protein [Leptolyngbya sp. FACHB-36]|uniref:hypothetical protein n=1 Tax=Leptolyngbya sp. FACHB-36 TaxID=2692808 RepID=UPI0018EFD739|nr:hypothetical protein [Leptolyngbya sp. FACHB-36]
MPKQYGSSYELQQAWGTYGVPQYLYTDGGKEFHSKHLEHVASELKIVLCQRRYPVEGGIVERPYERSTAKYLPRYRGTRVGRSSVVPTKPNRARL